MSRIRKEAAGALGERLVAEVGEAAPLVGQVATQPLDADPEALRDVLHRQPRAGVVLDHHRQHPRRQRRRRAQVGHLAGARCSSSRSSSWLLVYCGRLSRSRAKWIPDRVAAEVDRTAEHLDVLGRVGRLRMRHLHQARPLGHAEHLLGDPDQRGDPELGRVAGWRARRRRRSDR